MRYGYPRVSSNTQDYTAQTDALKAAGCERIFSEKASGKSTTGRREFDKLMRALAPGDIVTVTKLDRLARSSRDLQNILHDLAERCCGFVSLGESWCDTTTEVGRLMMTIMGGIAEFERGLIRKRCEEGIASARTRSSAGPLRSTQASAAALPNVTRPARLWPNSPANMTAAKRRSGGRCNSHRAPPAPICFGPGKRDPGAAKHRRSRPTRGAQKPPWKNPGILRAEFTSVFGSIVDITTSLSIIGPVAKLRASLASGLRLDHKIAWGHGYAPFQSVGNIFEGDLRI